MKNTKPILLVSYIKNFIKFSTLVPDLNMWNAEDQNLN
jgi:hypothetical protein